jgi:hypothetical protein
VDTSWLELIHIGVTIALSIVGALVIQPLRDIRRELFNVTERLAYIEGQMEARGAAPWTGADRRHGR